MRIGYAIRDRRRHGWLKTRTKVEEFDCPVTVWVQDEDEALQFRRIRDARRLLKLLRCESQHPEKLVLLSPAWKEMG